MHREVREFFRDDTIKDLFCTDLRLVMPDRSQQDPVLDVVEVVVLRLARDEDVGAIRDRVVDQERAAPAADGHLAHRPPREGGMAKALDMEDLLDPQQEIPLVVLGGQFAHDRRTDLVPGVVQRVEVHDRLLVRVRGQERSRDRLFQVAGHDDLQARFRLAMRLPDLAAERLAALAGPERPRPADPEAARVVVANRAGARREQRVPDRLLAGHGDKGHELEQQAVHRFQDADVLQPDHLRETEIDPARRVVQVRVGRIDHQIVLAGLDQATLHVVSPRQRLEWPEGQRMMGDDEVAFAFDGLVDHLLRHVQAQ